jgi:hypothetical protein
MITMNILRFPIVFSANFVLVASILAQPSPALLPFQGRLTDANGQVVPDGAKVVQFKIYDAPVGGSAVWQGEVQKLSVNDGLVSTMLGTKSSLNAIDFDRVLYLEITADANNDNAITMTDPPLLPRQVLLPSVFAKESANSRKLGGFGWNDLLVGGSTNPATGQIGDDKLSAGLFLPVGGDIMWWGTLNQMPTNFELCDGGVPTTPGALLQGNKPDLRDRFAKGATSTATDVKSSPIVGGSNTNAGSTTGGTAITAAQMPSHQHSVSIITSVGGAHSHTYAIGPGDAGSRNKAADGDQGPNVFRPSTDAALGHSLAVVGNTGFNGSGQAHSHTFPAQDNRPAFLEMFFIIRVK